MGADTLWVLRLCIVHCVQVSSELKLQYNQKYKSVAFASGLFLDATAARVIISYGSGDSESRVLVMSLDEVEAMFRQGPG